MRVNDEPLMQTTSKGLEGKVAVQRMPGQETIHPGNIGFSSCYGYTTYYYATRSEKVKDRN